MACSSRKLTALPLTSRGSGELGELLITVLLPGGQIHLGNPLATPCFRSPATTDPFYRGCGRALGPWSLLWRHAQIGIAQPLQKIRGQQKPHPEPIAF